MIYEFIEAICDTLDIDTPVVSFDTSQFLTETTMAQCSSDGKTIYLRKYEKPNPDQLFAIAHELRHFWQIRTDEEHYFANYKQANQCASVEEYNLQTAELDANAFGCYVMQESFGLKALFNGMNEDVKQKIYDRVGNIKQFYESKI